jgi:hypothetical protein
VQPIVSYLNGKDLTKYIYKFLNYDPHATQTIGTRQIYIDDIDSFSLAKEVTSAKLGEIILPLPLLEIEIQTCFGEILGERFIPNHWGGEDSDLYTNQIKYRGQRLSTGFIFKGRGYKKPLLTISGLGKNGDQIVRLTAKTLDLYVVQYVGFIHQNVKEELDAHAKRAGDNKGKLVYYCLIDGTDTARLFRAYGKI